MCDLIKYIKTIIERIIVKYKEIVYNFFLPNRYIDPKPRTAGVRPPPK